MIENVKIGHGFVHVTVHQCIFHLHVSIDTWRASTLLAIVRILINIRVIFCFLKRGWKMARLTRSFVGMPSFSCRRWSKILSFMRLSLLKESMNISKSDIIYFLFSNDDSNNFEWKVFRNTYINKYLRYYLKFEFFYISIIYCKRYILSKSGRIEILKNIIHKN